MGVLTCRINSMWNKQLIRNDYTNEEFWVDMGDIPETLHNLLSKNNLLEGVWFEGSYTECNEIIYRYENKYGDNLSYTIN